MKQGYRIISIEAADIYRQEQENGKFLYYFYDRKKLTSVALPEEQFDKLVEMGREYYNLERRENDHKTTFKKSANA